MAEQILDKASYSLVRTNPKLTGNVKLLTNGNEIYLESFSANNILSSSSFKAFKIDGTLTYDQDVHKFFKKGTVPTDLAYEVFQEFEDTSVLSSYSNQYEMFYSAGARSLSSTSYSEDIGMLSPIWLNEQIPNYFVVFKMNDPLSVNNVNTIAPNSGTDFAQTSDKFNEFVLQNCTAIKTFDLTEKTKLGSYIRRYVNQDAFPKAPLTTTWRKDEPILWNGISYAKGGFTSSGSYSYDSLITKDATILQNEYFFTQGFQRNGILSANLINLEFLFSDNNSEDYSINRYFGLYVNDVNEGSFKISGDGFYSNIEKTQLPKIKTITEVSKFLNKPLHINNSRGVLLYIDEPSIVTDTGIPTHKRVSEVESIFYVKDKTEQFHTVKKGSYWNKNEIRLFDTNIDVSTFTGFEKPDTFANAQILKRLGRASASITVNAELPDGITITFFNGNIQTAIITANESLTAGPGTSFESFFNPKGTTQEIAYAINKAIKFGINEETIIFKSLIDKNTVYLQSRLSGTRFNQLKFSISWIEYPELVDSLITYPITSSLNESAFFVGGTDKEFSLLLVEKGDQNRFVKGEYVKTKASFAKIIDWAPYIDEPVVSSNGTQIKIRDVDKYVVISLDDNQIEITRLGQVALYAEFKPSFGRFSFYPIKDFDFDFYSEMYSKLGELNFENAYYNKNVSNNNGVSGWPDIENFYNNGGFSNLIGLLKEADPDVTFDINILSEYQRLEENFLKEQAVASRIIPYINKWVWYDDGTDVRNNPYRLNLNLAFGLNNFAPSKWDLNRSAEAFTHEWYYLCKFPEYFDSDAIKSSWSYFNEKPIDNIDQNLINNQVFVPGTFQRTDINKFDEYFITDRFNVNNDVHIIDRQLRFGRFSGGNTQNFAECFLRGVKVIAKSKSSGDEKQNFNAKKLSYVANGKFNDYRFSVMVVPSEEKIKNKIKVIKNEKWKTIVMLIFISFESECLNSTTDSIDRTLLYSINSNVKTLENCNIEGPIEYKDSIMQGSLSFASSALSNETGQLMIQGTEDLSGIATSFFNDISIGLNGQYNPIEFEVDGDTYRISGISKIVSNNQLYATTVTKNNDEFILPSPIPDSISLKSASYFIKGGGYNEYTSALNKIGFGNIFNDINNGDPSIVYETIDINGNIVFNADTSKAQTFVIELRSQDDILKSNYIGILPDPNKPTVFNLSKVIGYDLSLQSKPRINPIARHSGLYKPLAKDIIFFKDPYVDLMFSDSYNADLDFSITSNTGEIDPDDVYKFKVFNLCRYKNTQFNSNHQNFGLLKNYFYHKVNEEDPSSVLELSTNRAFLSLYPLINEVGIDFKNYYIFSSNWEPGYFTKSIDKSKIQSIIGTRSMKEKKAFFASKYLKVPQHIMLETFKPSVFNKGAIKDTSLIDGTFMYDDVSSSVIFYLLIQKRLIEHLFDFIKPIFEKYVNTKFSFGNTDTLDDDVNSYIEQNILSLYKIESVVFYTKQSRDIIDDIYTTAELTNNKKLSENLIVDQNISTKTLNTNLFDLSLIYNKRGGFSNSYGFSITIIKK
jgi:hypothetical protein